MMDTAAVASDNYLEMWARLRDQALALADEAKQAPGPLTARKLRNQAALCDQYAVICHHAAWRELHPDPPE
jgi:hypothetical protein